jgi:transposase-like protein
MHAHWTPQRKARIVFDIIDGKTTVEQACEQYDLSVAELAQWQKTMDQHGVYGLRITRLHCYHPERRRRR